MKWLLMVVCVLTGCGFPRDIPLELFSEAEFKSVRESNQWEIFASHQLHELNESMISKQDLSICAMVASFTEGLHRQFHDKCKKVILVDSNLMTAVTLANLMDHPKIRADMASRMLRESLLKRYKYYPPYELYAGLFASIQDMPSRYFKGMPKNSDRNNYAVIAEFLRDNTQPWMTDQWIQLALFQRNRDVRLCAEPLKDMIIPDHDRETATNLNNQVQLIESFRRRIWTAEWIKPFLPDPGDPRLRRR